MRTDDPSQIVSRRSRNFFVAAAEGGQRAILATLGAFISMNVGLLAARGGRVTTEKKRLLAVLASRWRR